MVMAFGKDPSHVTPSPELLTECVSPLGHHSRRAIECTDASWDEFREAGSAQCDVRH